MSKQKIGVGLLYFIAFALAATGVLKIVGAAEAGEKFGNMNAPYILGVVELLIAVAIVLPKTRLLGVILAASYFGGAIAFSWLAEGETPGASMALNALLYAGAYLYRPSLADGGPVGTPVAGANLRS